VERLRNRYRHLTLVHAPIHASWLNQIEIYFSIVQRKVLTPNDFTDLNALAERLLDFQCYGKRPRVPSNGSSPVTILRDSSQNSAPKIDKNTLVNF
jgi:hypothetical protein